MRFSIVSVFLLFSLVFTSNTWAQERTCVGENEIEFFDSKDNEVFATLSLCLTKGTLTINVESETLANDPFVIIENNWKLSGLGSRLNFSTSPIEISKATSYLKGKAQYTKRRGYKVQVSWEEIDEIHNGTNQRLESFNVFLAEDGKRLIFEKIEKTMPTGPR